MANITTCKTWVHPSQSTVPPQYVILGVQNAQGRGAIYVGISHIFYFSLFV